jgi:hypothetical protein
VVGDTTGGRRLVLTRLSDIEPEARGERRAEWGPWHIDRDVLVLWTGAGGHRYEVDLEDCTTSAKVLDWICQVTGKQWGDARQAVVSGLVTALDDVLNPQAHHCSSGQSKQLSQAAIRRLAAGPARPGHDPRLVGHLPFHDHDLWCCSTHAEEAGAP